jgi:O-acetylhomoserine/O-acetylserine sulfhydrylase-like pyridoxal-dependent enzyme
LTHLIYLPYLQGLSNGNIFSLDFNYTHQVARGEEIVEVIDNTHSSAGIPWVHDIEVEGPFCP